MFLNCSSAFLGPATLEGAGVPLDCAFAASRTTPPPARNAIIPTPITKICLRFIGCRLQRKCWNNLFSTISAAFLCASVRFRLLPGVCKNGVQPYGRLLYTYLPES